MLALTRTVEGVVLIICIVSFVLLLKAGFKTGRTYLKLDNSHIKSLQVFCLVSSERRMSRICPIYVPYMSHIFKGMGHIRSIYGAYMEQTNLYPNLTIALDRS